MCVVRVSMSPLDNSPAMRQEAARGRRYPGLLHLVDWAPTFLGLAGLPRPDNMDGVDVWAAINNNLTHPRLQPVQ